MNNQKIPSAYGSSFESNRRTQPRIWDADYCLLRGLTESIRDFTSKHVKSHMAILDFGCGAKPYRKLFPADCTYVGVDAFQSPFADLVVEPRAIVPLADQSIDIILSTQVVYLVPDYSFYLSECRRLLTPGGRMLITTHGTWTYHPASGGDYYRFTQDGLRYILSEAGFEVQSMLPVVGTLGAGLHLRQLIFNSWLRRLPFGKALARILNVLTNCRIILEDGVSPLGTRMSSPIIISAIVTTAGTSKK